MDVENKSKESIEYRGELVTKDWPEQIARAQSMAFCRINNEVMHRIRYGSESRGRNAKARPCRDCAVLAGEYHVPGCDVEECPYCNDQAFCCSCKLQATLEQ